MKNLEDLLSAFLPALIIILYVLLDHLWEHVVSLIEDLKTHRWRAIIPHIWKAVWTHADTKTSAKLITAVCVILIATLAGALQYSKARSDRESAHELIKMLVQNNFDL